MALVIRLGITAGTGVHPIETLEVKRLTRLSGKDPQDQVHHYVAKRYSPDGDVRAQAEFEHRYGDGAWRCVQRALHALGGDAPELPVHPDGSGA